MQNSGWQDVDSRWWWAWDCQMTVERDGAGGSWRWWVPVIFIRGVFERNVDVLEEKLIRLILTHASYYQPLINVIVCSQLRDMPLPTVARVNIPSDSKTSYFRTLMKPFETHQTFIKFWKIIMITDTIKLIVLIIDYQFDYGDHESAMIMFLFCFEIKLYMHSSKVILAGFSMNFLDYFIG